MEGLSHPRPRSIQANDTRNLRVHPPIPHPRTAKGLAPYPPLRPVRQKCLCDNIARARVLLAASEPEAAPTSTAADSGKPSCPCCGGRMIIIEVFERGATPRHQPTAPTNRIRIDTS